MLIRGKPWRGPPIAVDPNDYNFLAHARRALDRAGPERMGERLCGVLAEANDRCLDALAPLLAGPVAPRRASSTLGMTVTDVIVAGTEEERERFRRALDVAVERVRRDNEEDE